LIVLAALFPKRTGDRRNVPEMAARKAIATIHTAEIQYYS